MSPEILIILYIVFLILGMLSAALSVFLYFFFDIKHIYALRKAGTDGSRKKARSFYITETKLVVFAREID